MSQAKRNVLPDGQVSFLSGVHSHFHPRLVPGNGLAWAVNGRMRGGFFTPRPGYRKVILSFESAQTQTRFQTGGWFQGASYYQSIQGKPLLMASIAGKMFSIDIGGTNEVNEVTPDTGNFTGEKQTLFAQAEDWLIAQNGLDSPIIFDAGGARRADPNTEVPVGKAAAYGNGRLWVSQNRAYVAGDLVGSSSGNPTLNRRDAVLKFTENTYINEGGSFTTPVQAGAIKGMAFISNLDTSLGDGELVIFTPKSSFATSVPSDRTTWQSTDFPSQRYVSPAGAVGHNTIVNINGDLYFRSRDGIRSLLFARRDFEDFGNRPISKEVDRALAYDSFQTLNWGSAVLFDNRLLMTVAAKREGTGIVHRGLVALDFDPISGMFESSRPAYDGMWTGLDILQIVAGDVFEEERCFAFVLNNDVVELWEITRDNPSDWDGSSNQAIPWFFETRAFSFGSPFEQKKLDRAELWLRDLQGTANITLYTRPDEDPDWHLWRSWQESAKSGICDPASGSCVATSEYKASYRSRRGGGNPPTDCSTALPQAPVSHGYEHSLRVQGSGRVSVSLVRLMSERITEDVETECLSTTATETTDSTCTMTDFL